MASTEASTNSHTLLTTGRLGRRRFLQAGVGIAGAAGSVLLAACSQASPTPVPIPTVTPAPTAASKVVQLPTAAPTAAPTTAAGPTPTAATTPKVAEASWIPIGPAKGTPSYVRVFTGSGIHNAIGVELPKDAAPADQQTVTFGGQATPGYSEWFKKIYGIGPGWDITQEPLTRFDKYFNVLPGSATSWDVSSDGLKWRFHLMKNLIWSDGKPLTAHDYVYSFQRGANPKTGFDFGWFYTAAIKNWNEVASGKLGLARLGVSAADDFTFIVEAPSPCAFTPQLMSTAYPSPKQAIDKWGDAWSTKVSTFVGSGPFAWKTRVLDGPYSFVPNPKYNGIYKPYINLLQYKPVTQGLPAYQKGEIDAVDLTGSPGDLQFAQSDPQLKNQIHPYEDFMTYYLAFNLTLKPWDDARVRQALSHAIDRSLLTSGPLRNFAVAGATYLPPGFPAYSKDNEAIQKFDLAKAKQLLKDAGYPDGQGFPSEQLWLRGETQPVQNAAQNIAAQLQKNLGITVTVRNQDAKVFTAALNKTGKDKLPFCLVPYEYDWVDASDLLDVFDAKGRHEYTNQEYNYLLKKASSPLMPLERRNQLYTQAETILLKDAAGVFLWHPVFTRMWKPYLLGSEFEPVDGVQRFQMNERLEIAEFQMYIGKKAGPSGG